MTTTATPKHCTAHPFGPQPCPQCAKQAPVMRPKRVTALGTIPPMRYNEPNLATDTSPEAVQLRDEWAGDGLNLDIRPEELRPGDNNIDLWWKCKGDTHHPVFQGTLQARRRGHSCPECSGQPRAIYIIEVVRALIAAKLTDTEALMILGHIGFIDPDADEAITTVKGIMGVLSDEGLTDKDKEDRDDAIVNDPDTFVDTAATTGSILDAIKAVLDKINAGNESPADEEVEETEAEDDGTAEDDTDVEEETEEERRQRGIEAVEGYLDSAEARGDGISGDGVLATLLGDDFDMVERLVRSTEADLWEAANSNLEAARATATDMLAKGGRAKEAATNFLRQSAAARDLTLPGFNHHQDDGTPTVLTLPQRRTVVTLEERRTVLNAMAVGGGKTVAAIASAMKVNAGVVVVVCPAALREQWETEIREAYGSAAVEIHKNLDARSHDERPDWYVLSVDTFSLENNEVPISAFTTDVEVDVLIVDEVHKAKQRNARDLKPDTENVSQRSLRLRLFRSALAEVNPGLRVLGMTGTPLLNDLREPISLLELILGKDLKIKVKATPGNIAVTSLELRRHGIITKPSSSILVDDPAIALPPTTVSADVVGPGLIAVDMDHHKLGELLDCAAIGIRSTLDIEKITLAGKAEAFAVYAAEKLAEDRVLDPDAVIVAYTRHVEAVLDERIVELYAEAVRRQGLTVRTFTANSVIPEKELSSSSLGCGVVIGTQPMGTGVNRLQNHARRLVILSAPYTWADWEQLRGRLARTGQKREVVVAPVLAWFDLPSGRRLSAEAIDITRVLWKKALADAVLYGTMPPTAIPDPADVVTSLINWQDEVIRMITSLLNPALFATVPVEWWDIVIGLYRKGKYPSGSAFGELSRYHRQWFHETTGERWDRGGRADQVVAYNIALRDARKDWSVDPADVIADHLRGAAIGRTVIDAGSGTFEPKIAVAIEGVANVKSYDMASEDARVQVADVTALPEPTGVADYYVLCQAIMGTNAEAYLREANRCLRSDGFLYLAETTRHFGKTDTDVEAGVGQFRKHLASLGFAMIDDHVAGSDPAFVIIKAIKVGSPADVAAPFTWTHLGEETNEEIKEEGNTDE